MKNKIEKRSKSTVFDSNMWDSNFMPIFLFGIDEFLTGNIRNIVCSLQRMAVFVKQWSLVLQT